MSGDIPQRVTCEVCGTAFDPSESRGWCPNEACGQWQHPAFPLSDDRGTAEADGGVNAPTKVCPNCGKDVRVDANFCKFCSHEFEDEPVDEPETGGSEPGLDQCPDCGADLSSIPADRLNDCPICGTNLTDVLAERTEPTVTPGDLTACPACGESLTDIPSDMRMVCPGCRVDLREAIEEHDVQSPDDVSPVQESGADAEDRPEEANASVDTLKGVGASYAQRLTDVGVETVGDLVAADTAELAAMTDISETRLDEWKERAPVDPADLEDSDGAPGTAAGGQSAGQGGQQSGQQGRASGAGGTQGGQSGQAPQGSGRRGQQGSPQQGGRQGGQGRGQQGGQGRGRGQQGGQGRGQQGGQQPGRGGQAGGQSGPGSGGQPGGAGYGRAGRDAQPNYETLVLEVMGQEIRAQPGDSVGREIRTAMVEGGAPDEDAVYVHREHVRVEQEGNSFYLERLGQNSLKVNGEPVGQHDRVEVESGDVVSFSEVVSADLRLE